MLLKRLVLRHFRNYRKADVTFAPGLSAFCGANAQGKTSLLEAVYLCLTGRSFRCHQIRPLIQEGQSFFSVELQFTKQGHEQILRIVFDGKERTIEYNASFCSGTAELLGILQGVALTLADMDLIQGTPKQRRQFIDLHSAKSNPGYLHQLARYGRAMRQRNALLRSGQTQSIACWEEELARCGAYIALERSSAIEDLSQRAARRYLSFTEEGEPLQVLYKTSAPVADGFENCHLFYLRRMQELRTKESAVGLTLIGPHRDDLAITVQSRQSKEFASQGQQYSCAAALRLAEWERLRDGLGYAPLFVIDDIALPLDPVRKKRLFAEIAKLGQVFVSSAQFDKELFTPPCVHYQVHQGCVEKMTASCPCF